MDLKKRKKSIKDKLIKREGDEIMNSPFGQVADTVIHLHTDDDEFKEMVRKEIIKEVGRETTNEFFNKFKKDLETEKDQIVVEIYMASIIAFIKRILEHTIVKEDHKRIYNNIIKFLKGLSEGKEYTY